VTPPPSNDWEWLSVAQHHGLPTRMLDWSYNPLVALFFAAEKHPDSDGKVFALRAVRKKHDLPDSPFRIDQPVKLFPNIITPRIRAQEGVFVVCHSLESSLERGLPPNWSIDSHIVPAAEKKDLQYELFRLGVHASSLFPGLDGLSARLKWQHGVSPLQEKLASADDC